MPNNQNTANAAACATAAPPATARTSYADTFNANPHLAAARLVRRMNFNAGYEPDIHKGLADALDLAARSGDKPRPLAGSITIVRNRTSQTQHRHLTFAPTAAELASLLAGEHLAHDLLRTGMPDSLAAQADAIAHYAAPIYKAYAARNLERRGVHTAEAAARHFLNHGRPNDLVFTPAAGLRRWYDEQCELADLETRDQDVTRLLSRPRLVWAHPGGIERGLLVDRFHHTHLRGAIERDTWTRRKVAEALAGIDAVLAPAYAHGGNLAPGIANLGVRVHAHRAPKVGVHFLPDYAAGAGRPVVGGHHRLGGCQHCSPRTALPNSAATSSVTSNATADMTGVEVQS
jgi:hypothetical protein